MKKSLNAALLLPALFACTSGYGQELAEADVPAVVKTAFAAKFPAVQGAKWELEDPTHYEASFTENNTACSATFDLKGGWAATETEIKQSDLPAPVKRALSEGYAGQKMKEFERVETVDKGTLYEVEMEKGETTIEVQLDPSGKVLGSKVEEEDEKGEDKDGDKD